MEEKKRILKMIEEGKISAEEGMKLLDALGSVSNNDISLAKVSSFEEDFFKIEKDKSKGKMLYIRVLSSDGDKVKVNIPLEFLKIVGGKNAIGGLNLDKHDVDINNILEAIDNGFEGRLVEVESDDDKVIIEIA